MNLTFVQMLITKHESFRSRVYIDSKGNPTVGIGFNLADPSAAATCQAHGLNLDALLSGVPITLSDAQAIRDDAIMAAQFAARGIFPNFTNIPDDAQAVILDMLFNLGETKFREFVKFIDAVIDADYQTAANEMRNSEWFHEVGARGIEDVSLMESA